MRFHGVVFLRSKECESISGSIQIWSVSYPIVLCTDAFWVVIGYDWARMWLEIVDVSNDALLEIFGQSYIYSLSYRFCCSVRASVVKI